MTSQLKKTAVFAWTIFHDALMLTEVIFTPTVRHRVLKWARFAFYYYCVFFLLGVDFLSYISSMSSGERNVGE